jgi:hypothetical protein
MGDFVNAISVIDEAKDNPRPDTQAKLKLTEMDEFNV